MNFEERLRIQRVAGLNADFCGATADADLGLVRLHHLFPSLRLRRRLRDRRLKYGKNAYRKIPYSSATGSHSDQSHMPKSIFTGDHQSLVEVLIAARKDAGLTQTDLASKIGKDQTFISIIERSQRRVDVLEVLRYRHRHRRRSGRAFQKGGGEATGQNRNLNGRWFMEFFHIRSK
ncbi:helix-turn-helix domain-containing protein [Caulobacter segnis]